jgi:peptidoglycan/xylan/chitin deacetylase (PgdA/CDA1 family)
MSFDQILTWVGSAFAVLPLDEAVARMACASLPARALAITFDDGYADNYHIALPILRKHRMSATFFVASDFIDGGRMWNDTITEALRHTEKTELDLSAFGMGRQVVVAPDERRRTIYQLLRLLKYMPMSERDAAVQRVAESCGAPLPTDLMMTSAQLRELRSAGMLIGGHTRSHPILAQIDDASAREQILGGRECLESVLGEPVTLFAYPNGKPQQDYGARHAEMVRAAGFAAAVTTAPGMARCDADTFQLPRFTPWDRTPLRFGLRLARNMHTQVRLAT